MFYGGFVSKSLTGKVYLQITASIIKKSILLIIVESMHDTVTTMVSIPIFQG